MASDNADQIAEWNGAAGKSWVDLQRETDAIVAPFGAAALQRAAAQPGERVLDIGCGCGDTALALAHAVGPAGRVLGLDVSQPMLAVARARAGEAGLGQLEFREADASAAALPADNDLVFSRFGVMFFAQPQPALAHLGRSMRPGGRCVFVCWRPPRDNLWAMVPLGAARQAMQVTPEATDPTAPGPFAFADGDRLAGLLAGAGFEAIELQRVDAPVTLGATPRGAAENALRVGPTSRFARSVDPAHLPKIGHAIEAALTPHAAPDGVVRLAGSTWVVVARQP